MPLTSKGREIYAAMRKQYGSEKKAKEVLYASKNAGRVSGIDATHRHQRSMYASSVRDALASGRSVRDAIHHALTLGSARHTKDDTMSKRRFRRSVRDAVADGMPPGQAIKQSVDDWSEEARKAAFTRATTPSTREQREQHAALAPRQPGNKPYLGMPTKQEAEAARKSFFGTKDARRRAATMRRYIRDALNAGEPMSKILLGAISGVDFKRAGSRTGATK